MDRQSIIQLAYVVAAVLFIAGLKGLTHPRTASRGNRVGARGMLVTLIALLRHLRGRIIQGNISLAKSNICLTSYARPSWPMA